MEDIIYRIIEYIETNKVSTTEVADCLGKSGVVPDIYPIKHGLFRVGKVKWVYAFNESNWEVHEQVRDVQRGDIVYIECFDCKERAVIGELVSKFILLYRRGAAIVTNGRMRDAHRLIKGNYSVWCKGFSPVGCFNTKNETPFDEKIIKSRKEEFDGAVMVCDDSGVVLIPKEQLTEEFYEKLEKIEEQEDIWFDCIDRRKWDTFDTVCLKKYRDDKLI